MKTQLKFSTLSTFTMLLLLASASVQAQKNGRDAAVDLLKPAKDSLGNKKYLKSASLAEYVDYFSVGKLIPSFKGALLINDSLAQNAYQIVSPKQVEYTVAAVNKIYKSGCTSIYPSKIDTANFAKAWPKVIESMQAVELHIKKDTLWSYTTAAHFDSAGNFQDVQWSSKKVPFVGDYPMVALNGCGNQYPVFLRTCMNNAGKDLLFAVVDSNAVVTKEGEKYQPKTTTVTDTSGNNNYRFSNTTPATTGGSTVINNISVTANQDARANASATASAPVSTTASSNNNDGGQNSSTGGSPVSFSLMLGGQPNMAGLFGLGLGTRYNMYSRGYGDGIEYYAYDEYGIPYAWRHGNWAYDGSMVNSYRNLTPCGYYNNWNSATSSYQYNYGNNNQVVYPNQINSSTNTYNGPHMGSAVNGHQLNGGGTGGGIGGGSGSQNQGPSSGGGHRAMSANNNSNAKTSSKVHSNSKQVVPAGFASNSKPNTKAPSRASNEWKPVAPAGWHPSQQTSVQGGNNHFGHTTAPQSQGQIPAQRLTQPQQRLTQPQQRQQPAMRQMGHPQMAMMHH